jgi:hypothetical protein
VPSLLRPVRGSALDAGDPVARFRGAAPVLAPPRRRSHPLASRVENAAEPAAGEYRLPSP